MNPQRNLKFSILVLMLILIVIASYLLITTPPWLSTIKAKINPAWSWSIQSNTKKNFTNTQNIQPNIVKYSIYSNPQMNISFNYPEDVTIKQITKQLISVSDRSIKDTDNNTLYIYSTTVPEDSSSFKIPFTIPGPMKHSSIIKIHGFTANQEEYSDGKNEVNFLILRQKNITIVMRIPQDSKNLNRAITQIVNSIQTLN
jgi:hypothetical protein